VARKAKGPGFRPGGALVVVPTIGGRRGNPVLWSRRFFPDLSKLKGDVRPRHLIAGYPEVVAEVSVQDTAAFHRRRNAGGATHRQGGDRDA
jgi:CTP:molybdopterin cytidylyltransferase MocA